MMILHYSMTEPEHGPASYRVMVPPAGGRVPPPRDCPPTAYGGPGESDSDRRRASLRPRRLKLAVTVTAWQWRPGRPGPAARLRPGSVTLRAALRRARARQTRGESRPSHESRH